MGVRSWPAAALLGVLAVTSTSAEPVPVRFREGLVRGFLTLRTVEGRPLAHGDLMQVVDGDEVSSRLVFHFHDGSRHDEKTVFSQQGQFRFLKSHLVQKGPAFERDVEATIDAREGRVVVRTKERDGKSDTWDEKMEIPPDLANGVILTALKNVSPDAPLTTLSMMAITPKPRLVKLEIRPAAQRDTFTMGGDTRQAVHYVVKVDIGGVTGLLADLVGKTPPDSHVWVLPGEHPAFVKSESPFYPGAPLWRIELASVRWPKPAAGPKEEDD
jgi:hypothetical protein